MFKDIIDLVSVTDSINDLGDPVKTQTVRAGIFADRKSVRQSEFYQAAAAGLRPEFTFVIRTIDYNQEPSLIFDTKLYNIIRTFEQQSDFIELVCQGETAGVI